MTITVRLATAAHLEIIEEITNDAYTKYIERLGRKPQPMTTDYHAIIAAEEVWLAIQDEDVAGLIVLQPQATTLLIYSVAVRPQWQKRGIGRRLLQHAEEEARRQGFSVVQLYTNELMIENIALYLRIGYRETARTAQHAFQVVYMEKQL